MKKVLIVDDEVYLRELLSLQLDSSDYNPTCAGSAEEALELAESDSFDCLITDYNLPGMNGCELSGRIKHLYGEKFPVIGITGNCSSEVKKEFQANRVKSLLCKPFDVDSLRGNLSRILTEKANGNPIQDSEETSKPHQNN